MLMAHIDVILPPSMTVTSKVKRGNINLSVARQQLDNYHFILFLFPSAPHDSHIPRQRCMIKLLYIYFFPQNSAELILFCYRRSLVIEVNSNFKI